MLCGYLTWQGVNPITSFFAAPSSSLEEPSRSLSPPVSPTSASDLEFGQHRIEHCQTTEESETGCSSRVSSSNDLEGMASFFSDGIINDEGNETLKTQSLVEPASCRNLFRADDSGDSDVDVKCTPTFGSVGSPVRQKSHLQVLERGNPVLDTCTRSDDDVNPCEGLEPTVIQCSPVEDSFPVLSKSETFYNSCSVSHVDSHHVDSKPEVSFNSDVTVEREIDQEVITRDAQSRLGFPPSTALADTPSHAPGTAKSSSAPKLKDLWQRNRGSQTHSSVKRACNNWEYKQGEIDEDVLAQLPTEIQKELRDSLKLNRPQQRPSKRPSISDFFPSSK